MRFIPAALQAHLDEGATTVCYCWKLTRPDAPPLGFTDHDRALRFDQITFEPGTGFEASNLESATGLAPDNLEVLGALSSEMISEDALVAGAFDATEVDLYLVNWMDTAQRVLIFRGSIGETTRGTQSFQAELRSLSHKLDQPTGRVFQRRCDAELGDTRCGVVLTPIAGAVTSIDANNSLRVSGFDDQKDHDFSQGLLRWTSGKNTGTAQPIREHISGTLTLWLPPPHPPQPGDGFEATPGCDKRFETCKDRFANAENFRGFPHMPGDDWLTRYPSSSDQNDGAALA